MHATDVLGKILNPNVCLVKTLILAAGKRHFVTSGDVEAAIASLFIR
jgi:hypothetical protein